MAASYGELACKLYPSAFSGEVVFEVHTISGVIFEGVAPKGFVCPNGNPPKTGINGQVKVRVLSNGGAKARISAPDGQILMVPAEKIRAT